MVMPIPAVKQSPYNIQYLSFQGGGGKGMAYLGALQWLEQYPDNVSNKRPAPLPYITDSKPVIASSVLAGHLQAPSLRCLLCLATVRATFKVG